MSKRFLPFRTDEKILKQKMMQKRHIEQGFVQTQIFLVIRWEHVRRSYSDALRSINELTRRNQQYLSKEKLVLKNEFKTKYLAESMYQIDIFFFSVRAFLDLLTSHTRYIFFKHNPRFGSFGEHKKWVMKNNQIDHEYALYLQNATWLDELTTQRDSLSHYMIPILTFDHDGTVLMGKSILNRMTGFRAIKKYVRDVMKHMEDYLIFYDNHFYRSIDKVKE